LWGPRLKLSPPKLALEIIKPETFGGANSKIPSQSLGQPQMSLYINIEQTVPIKQKYA